jgi:uncharacterized protein (TIGR03437 family)
MAEKPTPRKMASLTTVSILTAIGMCGSSGVAYTQIRAYVTDYGSPLGTQAVLGLSVIDASSNTVVTTVGVGDSPIGVAITPDGTRAYVANSQSSSVSVVDTSSNKVVATVRVGATPAGVAITPDGTRAYVANSNSSSVSVIQTSSNTVVATISVANNPYGLAITPDGTRAYVTIFGSSVITNGSVAVIDTSSNAVVATAVVGLVPEGVAITPDGTRAYVTNSGGNAVSVIDTSSNAVVSKVVGLNLPAGVAITPDGTRAYVTNTGGTTVAVVDIVAADSAYNTVLAKVGVGSAPWGIAITPDGTRAYVANEQSKSVSVIDTSKTDSGYNTVVATVGVGVNPMGVAVSNIPATGNLPPVITSGGIVPATVQPGEWVSVYGTNLAGGTATWKGDFPTSLGGTSVTVDGRAAYLSYVSPTQINLQVPNDMTTGAVQVVVTTAVGSGDSTVTLALFGPTFFLLDADLHVAGIILRSDGSGAYGGGTYDLLGPTGTSLGYPTVAAKEGDLVELFGGGFGPTNPPASPGQPFSGAAPTTNPVTLMINKVSVTTEFAGLSGAGVYQINLTVPSGLGTGGVSVQASVGGVETPAAVFSLK